MPQQDWIRVLRGVGLVAEQVVKNAKPLEEQSKKVLQHVADLATLVPQVAAQVGSQHQHHATPPPADSLVPPPSEFKPAPTMTMPVAVAPAAPITSPVVEAATMTPPVVNAATTLKATVEATAPTFVKPTVPSFEPKAPFAPVDMPPLQPREWTEKHVPSTPLARIVGFGALAARLAVGTATAVIQNPSGEKQLKNALISDANAERLADALCTMRGAALKLGQMLSIQDESTIPPQLAHALDRVRQGAHIMPKAQLHAQLTKAWGDDWRAKFESFDENPVAAASIGQVHQAVLLSGERVAVKIQYPGVADSIASDLLNLKRLVTYMNIFPKGLYIDEIIRVGQDELTVECDYENEAANQRKFKALIHDSILRDGFIVPDVYDDVSTSRVLTTSWIAGVPLDKITTLSQEVRNDVARKLLQLTMHELFVWRFMQTDPNWSNFMYDATQHKIGLIDFGAARSYEKSFVDTYFDIVWGAASMDPKKMMDASFKLGFLTGDESKDMLKAHEQAGMVVGEPFASHEPYDFYNSHLTQRLAQHTDMFMKGRLTPPPQEVYSLHRKLAGAFLMCIKLKAVIPCRDVLEEVAKQYQR
ncbi:aarF domain-containing kinase [Saprolegnia diclina VS20]|uniref:AarF domain-containing kinase n=1 Tax=Saprolegnia diclina (strain VS20) TaxID=1156394 RepID=T0QNN2_SAPDV|nr:aarF domain-containing kinase [Saprolegnia diclina VS20]EQC35425.1 aarF domain-containing kinase [Saprolegnia diclina VS20]|eukprot:XP_008611175.1 aarF domain-containing kinase [Saprolegnia diclina VS20]